MGPLFYYELVRLARRGRGIVLRCAYAAALLAALYLAYGAQFPRHDPFASSVRVPVARLASLSAGFVLAILWAQTAAVFVLTPAYLAGTVVEEKEQRTLDVLLTTRLHDREIVLGKLAARVTHLGGILLAGLPVVALTQLWGGVDMRLLVLAFAMTGLNLLGVAALSVFCSVYARSTWQALTLSYAGGAAMFLFFLSDPVATPARLFAKANDLGPKLWTPDEFSRILYFMCFHAAIAVVLGVRAVMVFRSDEPLPAGGPAPPDATVVAPKGGQREAGKSGSPAPLRVSFLSIEDYPLLWKETSQADWSTYDPGSEYAFRSDMRQMFVFLAFFLGGAGGIATASGGMSAFGNYLHFVAVLATAAWCVGTAFRAAGSVRLERDQWTLDGLLTLPCSRAAVVGAKWLGAVLRGRISGYFLAIAGVLSVLIGILHPAALLLVVAAVASQLGFWASLGLWLSVTCRTTVQARVTTALALLAFAGILLYQANVAVHRHFEPDLYARGNFAVNPLGAWWFLAFGWEASVQNAREAMGGVLVSALAGGLLWLDACRRFREG